MREECNQFMEEVSKHVMELYPSIYEWKDFDRCSMLDGTKLSFGNVRPWLRCFSVLGAF